MSIKAYVVHDATPLERKLGEEFGIIPQPDNWESLEYEVENFVLLTGATVLDRRKDWILLRFLSGTIVKYELEEEE